MGLRKRIAWIAVALLGLGFVIVVAVVPRAVDARINAVDTSGARPPGDHARNLHPSLRIAENGGMIGIGFFKAAVCSTEPARIAETVRSCTAYP